MIISLDKLPLKKEGRIIKLEVNPNLKRRLLDLGLVYNTKIKYLYSSPLNDPKAFLIRGSVISMRNDDIKSIYIYYNETKKDGDVYGTN